MTTTERIIHAVMFELIALALVIPLASMATGKEASSMVVVGVGLSLYTVVWNYFYNLWYDKQFGGDRETRSFSTRLKHTVGFEGGLIFVTVPVVAWFLQIPLLSALALEAVFLVFFFGYAIVFNWAYDHARARWFCNNEHPQS